MSSRSIRFDRSLHVRISLQLLSSSDPRCRSIAILRVPKTNRDSYPSCVYDLYSSLDQPLRLRSNMENVSIYQFIFRLPREYRENRFHFNRLKIDRLRYAVERILRNCFRFVMVTNKGCVGWSNINIHIHGRIICSPGAISITWPYY